MASLEAELLGAARLLLSRRTGQRGKLANARIRRSISTAYYALFHFLSEEVSNRLVGTTSDLRKRRRVLGRVLTHRGLKIALSKVKSATADASVAEFLRPPSSASGSVQVPRFVQAMARAFVDAQVKREAADYDLNEPLS